MATINDMPQDIIISILARVKLHKRFIVQQTSKKFAALVASEDLYTLRKDEKLNETIIIIAIKSGCSSEWYVLVKDDQEDLLLRRIALPINPEECILLNQFPSSATSEKNMLFAANGRLYRLSSNTTDFYAMSCVPPYSVQNLKSPKAVHSGPKVAVIRDKIYVFGGGCGSIFVESYDTKYDTWETIEIPEQEKNNLPWMCDTIVLNNMAFFIDTSGNQPTIFDPLTCTLTRNDEAIFGHRLFCSSCVINNLMFAFGVTTYRIEFYNSSDGLWRPLKGLEDLPDFDIFTFPTLLNYNCNLLLLYQPSRSEQIRFILVKLDMEGDGICGKIISSNIGLELKQPATIQHLSSVEL